MSEVSVVQAIEEGGLLYFGEIGELAGVGVDSAEVAVVGWRQGRVAERLSAEEQEGTHTGGHGSSGGAHDRRRPARIRDPQGIRWQKQHHRHTAQDQSARSQTHPQQHPGPIGREMAEIGVIQTVELESDLRLRGHFGCGVFLLLLTARQTSGEVVGVVDEVVETRVHTIRGPDRVGGFGLDDLGREQLSAAHLAQIPHPNHLR